MTNQCPDYNTPEEYTRAFQAVMSLRDAEPFGRHRGRRWATPLHCAMTAARHDLMHRAAASAWTVIISHIPEGDPLKDVVLRAEQRDVDQERLADERMLIDAALALPGWGDVARAAGIEIDEEVYAEMQEVLAANPGAVVEALAGKIVMDRGDTEQVKAIVLAQGWASD